MSSVHDGDIAPVLTALDLFQDAKYDPNLPVKHIAKDRKWRVSTVVPMGGRLTLERLHCMSNSSEEVFVRININDGVIPLPDCHSGPGKSCPLDQFIGKIQEKKAQVGEFANVCGTSGIDTGITFLRQPGN
jgi:acid phosphatase